MTRITLRPAKGGLPVRPEFHELFGDFFKDWDEFFKPAIYRTQPAANIIESDDRYELTLASPGFSKGDFEVEVENGLISIKANKKVSDEDKDYKVREFHYAEFKRTFQLPDTVDAGKISAQYENGLLKVALPKREEAKVKPAKKIAIL